MSYNKAKSGALAHICGSDKYPGLHGTVHFRQTQRGVMVMAELFGLPCDKEPSIFAFHIHEGGCCTGDDSDPFADAGGHYNPGNTPHPCHAGDMPPLFGSCGGYAYMSFFTDRFCVCDIIGRVVIIHEGLDDFTSQPAGNAGTKIACGKINVA